MPQYAPIQTVAFQQALYNYQIQVVQVAGQWQPMTVTVMSRYKRKIGSILKSMVNDEVVSKEEFEEILKLEKT